MENLDTFDTDMNRKGVASIDEVHAQGLWHQTFACWVFNPEMQVIYLQLRGPKNRVGANRFDASASGHLSAGESREDGFRELQEELGLTINRDSATYLGIYKNIAHLPSYTNNEFCHIYVLKTDKTLADFSLQDGEVDGLYGLKIEDTDKLLVGKSVEIKSLHHTRTITLADMCNGEQRTKDGYYKWIFKNIRCQMLTIKEVGTSDLENIRMLWNNGEVMKSVGFPNGLNRTAADMQTWFEKLKTNRPNWNRYAIYDADLGYCGETGYTYRDGKYNMDIKLLPHAQGKGIAKQAFSYAITQAFASGADEVHVSPWDTNTRSIPLYQKLGFQETHRESVADIHSPNPLFQPPGDEVIYMKLDKKDWQDK